MAEYRTGDIIDGDFEVRSVLGDGGFGMVLRVGRLLDGREYAMKLFYANKGREEVQRELRALQAVNHPNIVRVVWAGQISTGEWYLLTELVEGETLRRYTMPDQHLPLSQVVDLGLQLLDALSTLHPDADRIAELRSAPELDAGSFEELRQLEQGGLVHRDIKPENLIVDSAGKLVLIDFGIASRAGTAVRTQSNTYGYLPPDADLTRWSAGVDLFAAGAVLFELTCGQRPYDEAMDGPADPRLLRPDLLPSMAAFLEQACAPEAAQRFGTAREMRQALEEVRVALAAPVEDHPRDHHLITRRIEGLVAPFVAWDPHPLPSAGSENQEDVIQGLVEIVESEGPMLCERLYRRYVEGSGDPGVESVRRPLNRATYAAARSGRLAQVEPLGGGQANKTVYAPGTDPVIVRERGPRLVQHVPSSEVRQLAEDLEDAGFSTSKEDLLLTVMAFLDVDSDDWWAASYVGECLGIEVEYLLEGEDEP